MLIDSLDNLKQVLAGAIATRVPEWDWNFTMGNVLHQHDLRRDPRARHARGSRRFGAAEGARADRDLMDAIPAPGSRGFCC
jgi:hypothetical protein